METGHITDRSEITYAGRQAAPGSLPGLNLP
jgi:hypothetical protein